ncbi:ABC transporter permease [Caviibacterium pharyngocola]|uniref:ABC transporter permease n=1 Tax=Caviibacterium pharyngocola TaxID=28159 RepID=A0A2M8RVL4_9PAST|nr:ABC transporter permease [Caviibacterium pharyngocola]PJG82927.1 ABC transporter permease [Caviibacterium pharyngocola]
MRWFKNVAYLSAKELRSLFTDPVLMILIVYMFSVALMTIANMPTTEVKNAAVAVVDNDHSTLSYRLRDSLIPPNFRKVEEIPYNQIDRAMDLGQYTFVVDIPPNYERDMLKGQAPHIQLLVDATAMTQANIGASYINQTFSAEINQFMKSANLAQFYPLDTTINVLYNPNYSSRWFMGTMQIVGNLNLLVLLLVGAAVIRERERGTIEHLLVMPVGSGEIAVSKILANGFVLLCVAMLSLLLIVRGVLQVPIALESLPLFALGVITFLFSISSLGILLAIIAPTMPQFGLLCIPVYVVMYLLSGTNSPIENMPELAQQITRFSPTTLLGSYAQDVLFRGAGFELVWDKLVEMIAIGIVFLTLALIQFKSMLSRQG